jgi:hypothetical protein
MQRLRVHDLQGRRGHELGQFLSPAVPVIDLRCDLPPRWLPDGRVSFHSTHEGFRAVHLGDPHAWTKAGGAR